MMKNKMKWIFSVLCFASVLNAQSRQNNNESTYWSRGVFKHSTEGYTAAYRFQLWEVTFDKGRLTGRFALYQVADKDAPSIKIEGKKTVEGKFLPEATLQVESPVSGEWKTLRKNCNDGESATIAVNRGKMNPDLYVCLEVYESFLKTHKRGRVILNSGDAAVFELSDLAPYSP